jgi:serine/threonine protein kinase
LKKVEFDPADRDFQTKVVALRTEIDIQRKIRSKYVATLETAWEENQPQNPDLYVQPAPIAVYVLLEVGTEGSLESFVHQVEATRRNVDEATAKVFFAQLLKGLYAIHKAKSAHRDIAMKNVILTKVDGHLTAKFIDFGISVQQKTMASNNRRFGGGTPYLLPPEVVKRNDVVDLQRADVWAMGILLYRMLVGSLPAENPAQVASMAGNARQHAQIFQKPKFLRLSKFAQDLLKKLLEQRSTHRINLITAMSHRWLPRW